jgi:hypothetical protein
MEPVSFVAAVGLAVVTAVGGWVGAYYGAYWKKKGEQAATHEDIDDLVKQVKAVTEATKKIEAEISGGLWDKQKRWEMKREVLFQAAKRLAEVDEALLNNATMFKESEKKEAEWLLRTPEQEERMSWIEIKSERLHRWQKASTEFDETRTFVTVICSKETAMVFSELGSFINVLASEMIKNPHRYDEARKELITKLFAAKKAMRLELEVDPSSGSLAAQ